MIYENKILEKANAASTDLSLNDYCKMFGLEIVKSSNSSIDESTEQNAKGG